MRTGTLVVVVLIVCGCSKSPPPLSGGKSVSHWVDALRNSPDATSRKTAAFKLGNVGSFDPSAYPALVEALKDRDAVVRREAILALLKFGIAAQDAVPTLTELQASDRDPKVRAYATKALEKLQTQQ